MEISLRKGDIKRAEDHYRLAAKALNGEPGSDKADIALASVLSSSMGFYIDPSEEFTNVEEMRQALKGEWFRKRIEEKGYNQGVDSWGNGAYSYLVSEDNLADLNWYNVNDDMISELNRVLEKYEINTPERIRHFLAQCMVESGNGLYLREGEYVQRTQQEYENYYNTNTKYGYNYRGA